MIRISSQHEKTVCLLDCDTWLERKYIHESIYTYLMNLRLPTTDTFVLGNLLYSRHTMYRNTACLLPDSLKPDLPRYSGLLLSSIAPSDLTVAYPLNISPLALANIDVRWLLPRPLHSVVSRPVRLSDDSEHWSDQQSLPLMMMKHDDARRTAIALGDVRRKQIMTEPGPVVQIPVCALIVLKSSQM